MAEQTAARPLAKQPARLRRHRGSIVTHAILILGVAVMVLPFIWQLLTALKSKPESIAVPPTLLPTEWHLENFTKAFTSIPFTEMLINSVINTAGRTLGQLVFCALAAYAFARMRFPGRNILFALFLSVLMIPAQLLLLPQYQIIAGMGLLNTSLALFIPGMFSAFGTFLLRQFFLSLPPELEEAARIDGAGHLRIFWHIMVPLIRPGLAALAVITALWSWNDLLWPLAVSTDPAAMPVSAGLTTLKGQYLTDYPLLMAGSLIASLPMLVLYLFLQRHFVAGIAVGGSKS